MLSAANLSLLQQASIQQLQANLSQVNRDHPHLQTGSNHMKDIVIATTASITSQIAKPKAVEHNSEGEQAHKRL